MKLHEIANVAIKASSYGLACEIKSCCIISSQSRHLASAAAQGRQRSYDTLTTVWKKIQEIVAYDLLRPLCLGNALLSLQDLALFCRPCSSSQ